MRASQSLERHRIIALPLRSHFLIIGIFIDIHKFCTCKSFFAFIFCSCNSVQHFKIHILFHFSGKKLKHFKNLFHFIFFGIHVRIFRQKLKHFNLLFHFKNRDHSPFLIFSNTLFLFVFFFNKK